MDLVDISAADEIEAPRRVETETTDLLRAAEADRFVPAGELAVRARAELGATEEAVDLPRGEVMEVALIEGRVVGLPLVALFVAEGAFGEPLAPWLTPADGARFAVAVDPVARGVGDIGIFTFAFVVLFYDLIGFAFSFRSLIITTVLFLSV